MTRSAWERTVPRTSRSSNSLRLIPNLTLWRPADAAEMAAAWCAAIEHDSGPTCLILTRQGLPQLARSPAALEGIRRGGYVLADCQGAPQCVVIATGSEVSIALEAVQRAQAAGRRVRLAYRESVLPAAVTARVAVEAGSTGLWWRYVGLAGRVIGIDHYGASGKGPEVMKKFGFTPDHVERAIHESIEGESQ